MPQLVTVRMRTERGHRFCVWIPVIPVLILVSPLLLLGILGIAITSWIMKIRAGAVLLGLGRVIWSLGGTRIEVRQGPTRMLISLR
jgi:hypothetical protein